VKIEIGNSESIVTEADATELKWLKDFLTWENKGFMGRGGGIETLLSPDGVFPSGLIPNVWRAFKQDTVATDLAKPPVLAKREISVHDSRPAPPFLDPHADVDWLRHHPAALAAGHDPITHQIDAYNACVTKMRGIIWIPTGGGKGEIIAALTRAWPRANILILVPENVGQLVERIKRRTGFDVGQIGESEFEPNERITVASYQTMARRYKAGNESVQRLLDRTEVLLVDEAHTMPATGMFTVAMRAKNARVRIGFSATPDDRSDQKSLHVVGALGPIIYRVFPKVLIDMGIISEPDIRMVPCVQRSDIARWEDVYDELVVKSEQRNGTVRNIALMATQPGFVFVERERQGWILKKMLEKAGLNTEFVWGAVPQFRRKSLVKQLVSGHLHFLVCSSVFKQGLDVPTLASVINAAGKAATISTLQRLGRGGRTDAASQKYDFEYWDILDHGQRWLENHTESRVAAFRQEGYIPKIVTGLEEPNADGVVPDFKVERSGIELHRDAQKAHRDALFTLTGKRSIRRRAAPGNDDGAP